MDRATFGGGCFWCVEAAFKTVPGVATVVSGYAGGDVDAPTYEEVCSGSTGHAEVVQLTFDPEIVSYRELLDVFFDVHDPTTLNRQGPDVGTQYRSVVFTHDDRQADIAQEKREAVEKTVDGSVVTEIEPLPTFYPAEEYHQDFFEKNPEHPYCRLHVEPKVETAQRSIDSHLESS